MTQQSKKSRPPVPSKDYEQMQEFYKGQGNPRWKDISRKEALQ
ncbi:10846_t:CDS:1, partial [Dentiscutata heterogama]